MSSTLPTNALFEFSIMYLAGRCANGAERDGGTKYHAVSHATGKALCGAKAGRRSAGWFDAYQLPQPITCSKCLQRAMRATKLEASNV